MTKEEIRQAAQDWDGSGMATPAEEGAFIAGAEWMQKRMIDNPDGKALLYAVNKTAERTKREMIEKAVEWIKSQIYTENIFEYDDDEQPIKYICASCCDSVEEFIEKFKQAMQNERDISNR